MEERYHATTENRFYPDMSNINKNITVEAKLISPPTYKALLRNKCNSGYRNTAHRYVIRTFYIFCAVHFNIIIKYKQTKNAHFLN
jgi:hypothetical protein